MHYVGFEGEERYWPMKSEVIPHTFLCIPSTAVPRQPHISSTYGFYLYSILATTLSGFVYPWFSVCENIENEEIHVDSEEF
jgi:hypothetical protein